MKKKSSKHIGLKYTAESLDEYQSGSKGKILKNFLGITSSGEIHKAEFAGYIQAEHYVMEGFKHNQQLTMKDVDSIHRVFLGKLYSWAGSLRSVNISKGGFPFASAYALPEAIEEFESSILKKLTPCHGDTLEAIAMDIAIVHCEFLLLHPYREGNGRTARLLAMLMAYQAGLPGCDFSFIGGSGKGFDNYISAVQLSIGRNYQLMYEIILRALRRALRRSAMRAIAG